MFDAIDIVALIVSIVAAGISIATFVACWSRDRKINTIKAYTDLQASLFELYRYEDDEIEEYVYDRSSDEYKYLSTCLAGIEIFATGVKEKVYDFNLVYHLGHGYLDGALRKKIEYLIKIKNPEGQRKFYQNTAWLLAQMDTFVHTAGHRDTPI